VIFIVNLDINFFVMNNGHSSDYARLGAGHAADMIKLAYVILSNYYHCRCVGICVVLGVRVCIRAS
jgi:hypothetical protein